MKKTFSHGKEKLGVPSARRGSKNLLGVPLEARAQVSAEILDGGTVLGMDYARKRRDALVEKIPVCPKCGDRCRVCHTMKMGVANGCCLEKALNPIDKPPKSEV